MLDLSPQLQHLIARFRRKKKKIRSADHSQHCTRFIPVKTTGSDLKGWDKTTFPGLVRKEEIGMVRNLPTASLQHSVLQEAPFGKLPTEHDVSTH
jgi:hypothetical protein